MKPISSFRHLGPIPVSKEAIQSNQLLSELLRSVINRSDDIWALRSISDSKTGKTRMSSVIAEKLLAEVEMKEEWRLTREENLICTVNGVRLDNPIQRK